jgi:cystathionine beta-lyase
MDFLTPQFITDALRHRLDHSLFGYTMTPPELWERIIAWEKDRHGWDVKREWLDFVAGIVKGIGMVVNVFVKEDEKVLIQPPVYHPFRLVPQALHREVVFNPLVEKADGSYEMDFEELDRLTSDPKTVLMILCNPHNPIGITWSPDTLREVARICTKNHVLVISDEIHCDMAIFGNVHHPFASVSEEAANCSITFQAPSKTFNIAGIVSSFAVVPNPEIRSRFFGWLEASEFDEPQLFAATATTDVYTPEGDEWRRQMLKYVEGNILFTEQWFKDNLPQIKPIRPQASFLVWLDCRGLKLSHEDLISLFVDKARLALNDGEMFNPGGEGYMRLNVGTPRAVLHQALLQLSEGLSKMSLK